MKASESVGGKSKRAHGFLSSGSKTWARREDAPLPTLTAAESALLQLSDIAEKFGAGGAQFVLIALKALQDGRIALIEDVAAESLSIFSTRPVALLADATLLCERQR